MVGIVTKKDNITTDTVNRIIEEYNAQAKRESEAFQTLAECRDVYEKTLNETALNNYEKALEWYLQMADVTESLLTMLEQYGKIEWSDWLRVGSPAHPSLVLRRDI